MSVKNKVTWVVLVLLAGVIRIFSLFPDAVEKYYSNGLYPITARLQRLLFGWIPFSIGDIFYAFVLVWLIVALVRFIRTLIRRRGTREYYFGCARRIIAFMLWVYVIFHLAWGLNYDRRGIAEQLQLQVTPYSTGELQELVVRMATKLNALDSGARVERPGLHAKRTLFAGSVQAYDTLSAGDERFAYHSPSIKPSLFSYLGNYLGFGGYYDPFTGEAQVNTTLPVFVQPYTACHEIGHQLGYAKENEANFVGFLAAKSSPLAAYRYSVYFDMYLYAARELYARDSNLVRPIREGLKPAVRADFRELREFNKKYVNPLEPVISWGYGKYLKANGQPQGILTYNEVIAWLIAYGKKYGREAI